jgi:hypothetical protein
MMNKKIQKTVDNRNNNTNDDVPHTTRCVVRVDAIKFNHDPSSHTNDALNIRKNYLRNVIVPEWRSRKREKRLSKQKYRLPQQSRAAYSISDIGKNRVTIKVRFSVIPPNIRRAQIKAQGGGVLGDVKPMTVNFVLGISSPEYIEIALDGNGIKDAGVNAQDIEWQWMYRCIGHKEWYSMDKTKHRIYTVLKEPVMPWKQSPYPDTQNPWTDVLDFSCVWARRTNSLDAAAAAITKNVNLPTGEFEYDNDKGACHYSTGDAIDRDHILGDAPDVFYCTQYIERLNGGWGMGKWVNCTDCASIVLTFSNAVGCELWESKMGNNFNLNEVMPIGSSIWSKPFSGTFSFHEVAWKGSAELNDKIFDACLKVNGKEKDATRRPDATYRTSSLPLNMPFDDPGSFDYREKLVAADSIKDCLPMPKSKTRRPVM